jgi:hypothetical protein
MRRTTAPAAILAGTLLVGISPGTPACASAWKPHWQGELIGRVVNTTNRFTNRKLTVMVAGEEWTVKVPVEARIAHGSELVSVHDISPWMYVRVVGERQGANRMRADRVDVIGDRAAYRRSRVYRRTAADGYFGFQAGYRDGGYAR